VRRHAKASSPSRGRVRLTVLLATVAAFLLVPVAQAAAETLKVNIAGTGSGEVVSLGYSEGSPPIECSGPPATGTCENTFEGFVSIGAAPAPGSKFVGWTFTKGAAAVFCDGSAEEKEFAKEYDKENGEIGLEGACFAEGSEAEITATFEGPPPCEGTCYPLTVTPEGTGEGTVVSNPAGIECSGPPAAGTCSAEFPENTIVTLTASPAAGSSFTSWKKCDAKTETTGVEGRVCKVKMTGPKTVGAKFSPTYDVTVKKDSGNTGLGGVSGVICDANCTSATASFVVGKSVILKPKASKGSEFLGWIGCPEVVETVNCKVSAAATVEAEFDAIPKFKLTVNKSGGGQGTVKSKPASINCGLTCSTMTSVFQEGTEVELTAAVIAGKGSAFGGWSGGTGTCTGMTNPCKTSAITGTQSVTAEFK